MVAVRRLVDRDEPSLSLRRLLEDVMQHPDVLNVDRHVSLWLRNRDDGWTEREARGNYQRFAGASGERLDVSAVEADVTRVVEAAAVVKSYVDQRIAHRDLKPVAEVPTWGEINAAIGAFAEVVNKYASLFKATSYAQFEPAIQHDWEAPFRRAWLPAD